MSRPQSTLLALLFLAIPCMPAQVKQADRVAAQPEFTVSVRLAGHLPGWANPAADAGPVAAGANLHLTFVLSRAPEQQAAFTQLLADQQDPASPRYRQWLSPQQAGDLYGPSQHDIDALTSWLAARGLTPLDTSPSRMFVNATGSVAAVSSALATNFHYFTLAGEPRLSTTQEPALPSALAAIVQSIDGLSDTPILPMGRGQGMSASASASASGAQPRYTNSPSAHYITPGDFANIFDLNIPYSNGYTGVGQRIAIIGRSRVLSTDITEFEANTGLGANLPNTIVPGIGPDPGITNTGDQSEATLDVTRALGTAPSAQVDLVILPNSAGGIFAAAQYAVNTLNDPIMNISFGSCELQNKSGVTSWDTLFSQAASQGISVFVSSSDSGAATCDTQFATPPPPPAVQVASINYICASSYATCVGGTELADAANLSLYWSPVNSPGLVSTLAGYIPEGAWNEPVSSTGAYVAASGGGGVSLYIAKPTWQTGVGVPADGFRDVPDVSFPASAHDGYYACYQFGNGDCAANRFEYFDGTSTASPTMAALTAIVNQRTGARQGNFNPTLYRLAATTANNVFHDVTIASSGVIGCSVSIPSMCNNSTPSSTGLTGGLAGFLLTPGYDQATGWGSIDANNLLNTLATPQVSTTVSLSATSLLIYTGNTDTFTAAVSTNAGSPTGSVQFFLNGATLGPVVSLPTNGKAVTPLIPFAVAAKDTISAAYSGDASFSAAKSSSLALSVNNPGFSITAAPSTLTLNSGATTGNTATLTYTSLGGFTGTINQTCTVTYSGFGSPNNIPTCSYSAQTALLPSGGTVTGTITIASVAPGVGGGSASAIAGGPASRERSTRNPRELTGAPGVALSGVTFAALFLVALPGRSRRRALLQSLAIVFAIGMAFASISGCGGGGSSAPQPPSGSTAGPYTISLTSTSGSTSATPVASIPLTIH